MTLARRFLRDARTGFWHLRTGGPAQLQQWRQRRRVGRSNPPAVVDGPLLARYPAPVIGDRTPVFPNIRAGVILDDFSRLAFTYEWDAIPLSRTAWREQLDDLDLVFVESAWNGNGGQWAYQLTGESGVKDDVKELLSTCRARGIPTVFWNKEDPPHFDDFLEAAGLFDWVFTSDSRLIDSYRKALGHDRVKTLSFAAQPAVHNPARSSGPRTESGVAFAGMYFAHKYPERREQMQWLLGGAADAAAKTGDRFVVFSRQHGGDARYQFPDDLSSHVIGSLPYDRMPTAYKDFGAFLNVNSVVDSPSMCARRIFEISASGTPVVSAPSEATRRFFRTDEVFQPSTRQETADVVRALLRSPELRDRSVHLAQRTIWREHTYTHRAMEVMDALGLAHGDPTIRSCSAIVSTNRPQQLDHVLETVGSQRAVPLQLVLVTHGHTVDQDLLRDRARRSGVEDVVLLEADSSLSLGACLNLAIDAADGDVLAKIDDDDLYGPQYLADQISALRYAGTDIVGKQAHYMHLTASGAVLLRFPEREHKYTDFVMGPTMVGSRDVFRSIRFEDVTRGEDSAFQRAAVAAGATLYSSDRFNFVQVRSATGAHTWSVEESELLGTGVVHGYGLAPEHHFF
ncbi:glycosyltransferase family protein [Brevibacterium yomogidense]|uniref:glycosyltransferase family protein n=1 Tax=Brevibacterium yomogidense TaxID=946573 RepID=UPI002FCCFC0C